MRSVIEMLMDVLQGIKELRSTTRKIEDFDVRNSGIRSTSLADTGLSWTAPCDCIVCITGCLVYNNHGATEVVMTLNTTNTAAALAYNTSVYGKNLACTTTTHCSKGDIIRLFGKWSAATNNNAIMQGFYIEA